MTYALPGNATHLTPPREVSLNRTRAFGSRPEPGAPSIPAPARRRTLSRVLAAVLRRGPSDVLPEPRPRPYADHSVSPITAGATRGVAFLVNR